MVVIQVQPTIHGHRLIISTSDLTLIQDMPISMAFHVVSPTVIRPGTILMDIMVTIRRCICRTVTFPVTPPSDHMMASVEPMILALDVNIEVPVETGIDVWLVTPVMTRRTQMKKALVMHLWSTALFYPSAGTTAVVVERAAQDTTPMLHLVRQGVRLTVA